MCSSIVMLSLLIMCMYQYKIPNYAIMTSFNSVFSHFSEPVEDVDRRNEDQIRTTLCNTVWAGCCIRGTHRERSLDLYIFPIPSPPHCKVRQPSVKGMWYWVFGIYLLLSLSWNVCINILLILIVIRVLTIIELLLARCFLVTHIMITIYVQIY